MKPSAREDVIRASKELVDHEREEVGPPPEFEFYGIDNYGKYTALVDGISVLVLPKESGYETTAYTPKLTIDSLGDGDSPSPVQLRLGVDSSRGTFERELSADWYVGEDLVYHEEVRYGTLGPTQDNNINSFAWTYIQFRDALLELPLETALELGFRVEIINHLMQAAGKTYLAP